MDSAAEVGQAVIWLPLVGAALGITVAAIDASILEHLLWPLRNTIVVILAVTLSGAIHLDALMDTADGLAAPAKSALEVTRASVHTPHGIIAGALAVLLAWTALQNLAGPARFGWIVAALALGRTAIVLTYRLAAPRPEAGAVTQLLHGAARSPLATTILLAVAVLAAASLGPAALAVCALALALVVVFKSLLTPSMGGMSGDHYGAVGATVEVLTLIVGAVAIAVSNGR